MINGKWKTIILWHLNKDNVKRFNELQRIMPEASSKVLSAQLRQLESDGLISRKVYAEVPPKVEYYITDLGRSLWPVLMEMQKWSLDYLQAKNEEIEPYILEEFKTLQSKQ